MSTSFSITGEFIELCQLLKVMNVVMSGGEAKEVIAEGMVLVDGAVETRKRCKIRPGQTIEFEGNVITTS